MITVFATDFDREETSYRGPKTKLDHDLEANISLFAGAIIRKSDNPSGRIKQDSDPGSHNDHQHKVQPRTTRPLYSDVT